MFSVFKKKDKEKSKSGSNMESGSQSSTHYFESTTTTVTRRSCSVTTGTVNIPTPNFHSFSIPSNLNLTTTNKANTVSGKERKQRPSFLAEVPFKIQSDARPIPSTSVAAGKVNLNYQSPYLNRSPVYSSYRPQTSTNLSRSIPTNNTNYNNNNNLLPPPSPISKINTPVAKTIQVKATGISHDQNSGAVPTYKTSSKNRGEVLIINNILFKEAAYREGAELDHQNLSKLFYQIGFTVSVKKNLKRSDMEKEIKSFSKNSKLKTADISVVVLMSHGTNNNIIGGYTEIFGSDDKPLPTETVLNFFTSENCRYMANKPKIFIFQCCRGTDFFIRQDAKPMNYGRTALLADMLIAYSTLPGYTSLRDPLTGTWYIQTICEVFSEYAHQHDVEELLKIVQDKLSKIPHNVIQTSSYENRGFKKCYLHPIVGRR